MAILLSQTPEMVFVIVTLIAMADKGCVVESQALVVVVEGLIGSALVVVLHKKELVERER